MTTAVKKRSFIAYIFLSMITFGIYSIVFWTKLSKEVNTLCEGDGKKTMKYIYCYLLNIVTFGIFGFVWKYKLAERMRANAARYNLSFSESGALVVVLALLTGPFLLAKFVLVKNFNALAVAYNEYNGLVMPKSIFDDEEEEAEAEVQA